MEATLNAVKRDSRGKNEARRLRVTGQIPAVIYGGPGRATEAITIDPKALMRILHTDAGVNTLIALDVEGEGATRVLVKEYLLDPVRHSLLHVDFYRVAMDKLLEVTVQIVLKGEPKGVKQQGGVLDFLHREIEVQCLPADIPEHIEVDVSDLLIGQSVRVRDLPETTAWKVLGDPELMLVHVVPARIEVAPAAAEAVPAAAAEPEVIKKGKAEKAEGEA
jgi:large subunit ribosomal protein L25